MTPLLVRQRLSCSSSCNAGVQRHRAHCRRQNVAARSSNFDDVYSSKVLPERFWGDIEVVPIPGKGRGVLTKAQVPAGGLLMVSYPLGIVQQEEGKVPDTEQLVQVLEQQSYSPSSIAVLEALHDASEAAAEKIPDFQGLSAVPDSAAVRALDIPRERLTIIAGLNAFGEEFEDMTAALARKDTPTARLGLWPEFSLLNHACAPTAVSHVVGDRMLVRATRDLAPGEEVTVNYLGRDNLRPVAERQAALEEGYGFVCSCARCQCEGHDNQSVAEMVEDLYLHYQRGLGPALNLAIEADKQEDVDKIRDQLQLLTKELDAMFDAFEMPRETTGYLKASAFEVYNAAAALAGEAKSAYDGEPMKRCLDVLEGVAPGSDLQLLLSSKALQMIEQRAPESGDLREHAQATCRRALRLRYGELAPHVTELLLQSSTEAIDKILL